MELVKSRRVCVNDAATALAMAQCKYWHDMTKCLNGIIRWFACRCRYRRCSYIVGKRVARILLTELGDIHGSQLSLVPTCIPGAPCPRNVFSLVAFWNGILWEFSWISWIFFSNTTNSIKTTMIQIWRGAIHPCPPQATPLVVDWLVAWMCCGEMQNGSSCRLAQGLPCPEPRCIIRDAVTIRGR